MQGWMCYYVCVYVWPIAYVLAGISALSLLQAECLYSCLISSCGLFCFTYNYAKHCIRKIWRPVPPGRFKL